MKNQTLEIGQSVRITYVSEYKGIEKVSWKIGTVLELSTKWVYLSSKYGGYVPRNTIVTIQNW
jgi:hypothetical protein